MYGDRLRKLREDRNLTLRALGMQVGMSTNILSQYEHEIKKPPLNKLLTLADFYETTLDYISGRVDRAHQHIEITDLLKEEEPKKVYYHGKPLEESQKETFLGLLRLIDSNAAVMEARQKERAD